MNTEIVFFGSHYQQKLKIPTLYLNSGGNNKWDGFMQIFVKNLGLYSYYLLLMFREL